MQKILFIDLQAQQASIRSQIDVAIKRVLDHGQYIMGPEVFELERRLQTFAGAKHCISVASGTDALLISLMAIGVGRGDEVITTPFTFASTAEVIALLGAIPVFVDVEADTGNIDVAKLAGAVTEKTKVIMPVSLYGQPADMDEINAFAEQHGLKVVEDGCQSFGATYKGKSSCNLSTIGCTSFFPSKPLGCYGDGGAIFTSDDDLARACREIRVHGQSQRYVHTRIGVGGRLDTIQAAILLEKLTLFEWEVAQRTKVGDRYNQLMDQCGIQRMQQRPDRTSVFAQYTVLLDDRHEVQRRLGEGGKRESGRVGSAEGGGDQLISVPTAVHYPVPLNGQPAYSGLSGGIDTPIAAELAGRVLSLPMHAFLRVDEQDRIVNSLKMALEN